MAVLRDHLAKLGWTQFKTYIQSGNIILEKEDGEASQISEEVSQVIKENFGYDVPCLTLSLEEWEDVLKGNPYWPQKEEELKFLYTTFMDKEPPSEVLGALANPQPNGDEFFTVGKLLFFYLPGGRGNTKFSNNFFEKKLKVMATTRNWKTVRKLAEMAREMAGAK